jgi:branched-chain amino acid aminotransferase
VREDGSAILDVLTPRLDGTILPGVTRASMLAFAEAHPSCAALSGVYVPTWLLLDEHRITLAEVFASAAAGRLRDVFCAMTAATAAPVGVLGFPGREDVVLAKKGEGRGLVDAAVKQHIVEIQEGREEWEGRCVRCE